MPINPKFKRFLEEPRWWSHPFLWLVVSPLLTFGFLLWYIYKLPGWNSEALGGFVLFIVNVAPGTGLAVNLLFYPTNEKYLARLAASYLTAIVLFANVYFLLTILFDHGALPIVGIAPAWTWLPGNEGRVMQPHQALLSFLDCFHFSCMTMATVGYGDMFPKTWYAKMVVDSQVLFGLGLVVVGFGRFFSGRSINGVN